MRPLGATFSPPIVFATDEDRDAIGRLLASEAGGGASFLLRQEFERLSGASGAVRPFVRLGSSVTFRDLRTKRESTVRLVLTPSPMLPSGEVSITDTLGAALLGLSEGAIFRWSDHDGRIRALKALRVEEPTTTNPVYAKSPGPGPAS